MRIINVCMQCALERPGDPSSLLEMAEVRDDGVYTLTCDRGHHSTICLQESKFEILSELAINAIVDGYYREAVASFISSMERFFEFYLRIVWRANGLSPEVISKTWKTMAAQSERQLGAYVGIFFMQEGNPPPLLSPSDTKFRNDVIHNGYIPLRDQAIAFGNAIFEVIVPVMEMMREKYAQPMQDDLAARMVQKHNAARDGGGKVSTMTIATTFSFNRGATLLDKTTEDAIKRVEDMRKRLQPRFGP